MAKRPFLNTLKKAKETYKAYKAKFAMLSLVGFVSLVSLFQNMKAFTWLREYLKGAMSELKKVVWPTRDQTKIYSIIVIAMSLGMALFFGVLDYIFNAGLGLLI